MQKCRKKVYQKAPLLKSPLRYPGGKAKLRSLVKQIVSASMRRPVLYIEPFAGGAGVALALLGEAVVDQIVLTDRDPLVGQFWSVVFGDQAEFEELYGWVGRTSVTLREWDEVRAMVPESPVEHAFKCLFLNRTSFSGVLHPQSGPIGGRGQKSEYTVDCRFNKDEIRRRLVALRAKTDSVAFAGEMDYRGVMALPCVRRCVDNDESIFWYLDPPYFRKAEKLYNEKFDAGAHQAFREWVDEDLEGHWLLSYDAVPEALELWGDHQGLINVGLQYTARAHDGGRACAPISTREFAKEIFVSDLLVEQNTREQIFKLNKNTGVA